MAKRFGAVGVLLVLMGASPAVADEIPGPLMTSATASAAQMRLAPARHVSRSLSGGQKILLGAGVGAAFMAVPITIIMHARGGVDGKVVGAAGLTGAMFGAAISYKLIQ